MISKIARRAGVVASISAIAALGLTVGTVSTSQAAANKVIGVSIADQKSLFYIAAADGMKQAAKAAGAIVSFDLNYRAKLWNISGGHDRAVAILDRAAAVASARGARGTRARHPGLAVTVGTRQPARPRGAGRDRGGW